MCCAYRIGTMQKYNYIFMFAPSMCKILIFSGDIFSVTQPLFYFSLLILSIRKCVELCVLLIVFSAHKVWWCIFLCLCTVAIVALVVNYQGNEKSITLFTRQKFSKKELPDNRCLEEKMQMFP